MKRMATLIVPAILLGILLLGSGIIVLIVGTTPKKREIRVIAVLKTIDLNMEFWEVVKSGMRTAAKELDLGLEIRGPWAESDVKGQIALMDSAIRDQPDAIVLASTDFNTLVPSVEAARQAGIIVVTLDSGVNSKLPASFVATNNIEAGEKAGTRMLELIGTDTPVAVVNHIRGATTAMEREVGAIQAFTAVGMGDRLLPTRYTDNFEVRAYEITRELMKERPDIEGILAMNEVSTVGVARALQDLGLARKIRLVGFDNSRLEIKLIEQGVIDATVVQQPFNMGYLSVRAVRDALMGKMPERFIDTGSLLITKETMYLPENQKILFPFLEK